jgi:hypothetical protein
LSAVRQREAILALFVLLCFGFFHQVPLWNEHSRYDLVVAIVDHHTTQIDDTQGNTGDKAFFDGHYYSDKAPGISFLGVPVYGAMRAGAHVLQSGEPDPDTVIQVLAFTLSGLPTVLLAVLLLRFLRSLVEEWWALIVTVGLALGTIMFPLATMFIGHALTACLIFASFYVLWRMPRPAPPWHALGAGLLAGWAVLVDYSVLLAIIVVLIYALSRGWRVPLLMILGAVPPALLGMGYNWASFGGPLTQGYVYSVGFSEVTSQGFLGITVPKMWALHDMVLGQRGFLRLSPWLAVAPLGLWAARSPRLRREIAVCVGIALAFFLPIAGFATPIGGSTPGPRYLIPALPFLAVLVALIPRVLRLPTVALVAVSVALVITATVTSPSWGTEIVSDPLSHLWAPMLRAGDVVETTALVRWGVDGVLPLALLGIAALLAVAALMATIREAVRWKRIGAGAASLLVVLVVSLGTPVDATAPVRAAAATVGLGGSSESVAIVDAGMTLLPADEASGVRVRSWTEVQIGSRDINARVALTILSPTGDTVSTTFAGGYWQNGQHKRLEADWNPTAVVPGDYSLSVTVESADQATTYAILDPAASVSVG